MNLRLPDIRGDTPQQLSQIKSYLYQLTQELNFALSENVGASIARPQRAANGRPYDELPQEQFNSVKALIIKSADIVNAYYDEISRRLEGVYVAQSEYGAFSQETAAQLVANAESIAQNYEHVQKLLSSMTEVENQLIAVGAYINSGLLYYDDAGVPVYGLEVGQRTQRDGQEIFCKYARFTSDKLAFYDQAGNEAAYISDRKLRIGNAHIEQTLTRGGYEDAIAPDGSVTTRWVGI